MTTFDLIITAILYQLSRQDKHGDVHFDISRSCIRNDKLNTCTYKDFIAIKSQNINWEIYMITSKRTETKTRGGAKNNVMHDIGINLPLYLGDTSRSLIGGLIGCSIKYSN